MIEAPRPWEFVGEDASFVLRHPERTSYLYFPLANECGMKSAITPELQGDAKIDLHEIIDRARDVISLFPRKRIEVVRDYQQGLPPAMVVQPRAWPETCFTCVHTGFGCRR